VVLDTDVQVGDEFILWSSGAIVKLMIESMQKDKVPIQKGCTGEIVGIRVSLGEVKIKNKTLLYKCQK
jgi:selenocysteine-specific translation elongation factor